MFQTLSVYITVILYYIFLNVPFLLLSRSVFRNFETTSNKKQSKDSCTREGCVQALATIYETKFSSWNFNAYLIPTQVFVPSTRANLHLQDMHTILTYSVFLCIEKFGQEPKIVATFLSFLAYRLIRKKIIHSRKTLFYMLQNFISSISSRLLLPPPLVSIQASTIKYMSFH